MKHSIVTLLAAAALTTLACNNEAEPPAKPGVAAGALEPRRDQPESAGDREIAARVRRDVAADDQLSVSAKHVKIICRNGTVTLRGPVLSADERARIAGYARRVSGVQTVNDFLEVASN